MNPMDAPAKEGAGAPELHAVVQISVSPGDQVPTVQISVSPDDEVDAVQISGSRDDDGSAVQISGSTASIAP